MGTQSAGEGRVRLRGGNPVGRRRPRAATGREPSRQAKAACGLVFGARGVWPSSALGVGESIGRLIRGRRAAGRFVRHPGPPGEECVMSRVATVLLALALAAALPARALAQQFTVVDITYEHKYEYASHYRVKPAPATPSNWVTPVDFRAGRVYGHLEVLSKPSDEL